MRKIQKYVSNVFIVFLLISLLIATLTKTISIYDFIYTLLMFILFLFPSYLIRFKIKKEQLNKKNSITVACITWFIRLICCILIYQYMISNYPEYRDTPMNFNPAVLTGFFSYFILRYKKIEKN